MPRRWMSDVALQGQSQGCCSSPRPADASQMRLEGTLIGLACVYGATDSLGAIDAALVARGVRCALTPCSQYLRQNHLSEVLPFVMSSLASLTCSATSGKIAACE